MSATDNVAVPTIWSTWSPGQLNSRTRIPRRYVTIPSDQQKLLDRRDVWSVSGYPHVPPRVLEGAKKTLKNDGASSPSSSPTREVFSSQPVTRDLMQALDSHARRVAMSSHAEAARASSPPADASEEALTEAKGDSESEGEENEGEKVKDDEEEKENGEQKEDEEEPLCSWSPSPSAHVRSPRRQGTSPTATSTSSRRSSENHAPRVTDKPPIRSLFMDFPPSSSAASASGLEVEVPKAITDVPEPVHPKPKPVPVLEPTPPSAQVIPCTLTEKTSPLRPPEPRRRRRLMKPIPAANFMSPDAVEKKRSPGPALLEATSTGGFPPSSPMVRSTPLKSRTPPHEPIPASSVTQTLRHPPGSSLPRPATSVATTYETGSRRHYSGSEETLPPNGPPSQVPFTAFTVAYPDYEGNLSDFIRSVICILDLQKKRSLPEFLYDDFVRVFSQDYLEYIGTLEDGEAALPAVQYYNENVSRPLYLKGILNRDNVRDVVNKYPDKARAIQQGLRVSESTPSGQSTRRVSNTAQDGNRVAQMPSPATEQNRVVLENQPSSSALSTDREPKTHKVNPPVVRTAIPAASRYISERRDAVKPRASSASTIGIAGPSPTAFLQAKTSKPSTLPGRVSTGLDPSRIRIDSSIPEDPIPSSNPSRSMRPPMLPRPANTLPPSTALSEVSNADSIPDPLRRPLKRKPAPRASNTGPSATEPGAAFIKRPRKAATGKDKESAEQQALRFRQFLLRKQTQSSAPAGSSPS